MTGQWVPSGRVESIPGQVIAYMLREVIAATSEASVCDVLVVDRIDVQRLLECSIAPSSRVRDMVCRLFARELGTYLEALDYAFRWPDDEVTA
jgi:hypothetical protein